MQTIFRGLVFDDLQRLRTSKPLPRPILIDKANVYVIPVQLELVSGQYPALFAPVPQSFGPRGRSYYLIRSPPRRYAGEAPAYLQDATGRSVAFDRLAVNPPHIGGPAEVVGIGQATGLAVALWYARAVRNTGQEVVTLFERLDADPVPSGQYSERLYESLVNNPSLQISHRLRSRPEVLALQKLAHLGAPQPAVLTNRGNEIPQSTPYAGRARRGEVHSLHPPTSGEQRGTK